MKVLHRVRFILWLAVPLAAAWIWYQATLTDLAGRLGSFRLNSEMLVGLVLFNAGTALFFNSRWWLILRAQGHRVPYLATLRYRMAAFAVSYFTPGMQFGGEPLQVYALHSRHKIPASTAIASVTLDKLFELLANFSFLAIGLLLIVTNRLEISDGSELPIVWASGLFLAPAGLLILIGAGRRPLAWLAQRLERWLPLRLKARPGVCNALELIAGSEVQIAALMRSKPRVIFEALAASLLIWFASLAEYWLALRVLGVRLSFSQTILALTAARLAFLTPLPAGLGALEAGQMLAMQALGLSPMTGIAVSLWIRARDLVLGAVGAAGGAVLVKPESAHPFSPSAGD